MYVQKKYYIRSQKTWILAYNSIINSMMTSEKSLYIDDSKFLQVKSSLYFFLLQISMNPGTAANWLRQFYVMPQNLSFLIFIIKILFNNNTCPADSQVYMD